LRFLTKGQEFDKTAKRVHLLKEGEFVSGGLGSKRIGGQKGKKLCLS